MDIAGVYDGTLSPRKAGRLAYELPPEAAVYRGKDLNSRLLSGEEQWLRLWVNMNLETKDQIKSPEQVWEQLQREERNKEKAAARLRQRKMAQEG